MKNVISQSLGLGLVNINVYAKVYQNIPLSSRDRAIFTFSVFEPWQRHGQSQKTCDNLLGYILSVSMRMQNFIKISQTVLSYRNFSRTGWWQNLHKLSGDKIKCLIIGQSMKVNLQFQLTFYGSCNIILLMQTAMSETDHISIEKAAVNNWNQCAVLLA